MSDGALVAAVRDGDDGAFEELYRRYQRRIAAFVRALARDEARAEDITQDAFFSALRRLRATSSEIAFKPWIYEIARNAAIDAYRRTARAEEISMDADEGLRPSDRGRLVGSHAPDSALVEKEQLDHLRGALDELPETHHRILVMRELEGLSYREIGERLELTRPAVESTLFRARRRLEREYHQLDTGQRCESIRTVIAQIAEGIEPEGGRRRLARHARRCSACRRTARELGVEPLGGGARIAARAAAMLPLPAFLRRHGSEAGSSGATPGGGHSTGGLGTTLGPHAAGAVERIVAILTAAALAGAGAAVIAGTGSVGDQVGARAGHGDQRAGGADLGPSGAAETSRLETRSRAPAPDRVYGSSGGPRGGGDGTPPAAHPHPRVTTRPPAAPASPVPLPPAIPLPSVAVSATLPLPSGTLPGADVSEVISSVESVVTETPPEAPSAEGVGASVGEPGDAAVADGVDGGGPGVERRPAATPTDAPGHAAVEDAGSSVSAAVR